MKRFLIIFVLLIGSVQGYAQIDTISGQVRRTNGDTVRNFPVRVIPSQAVFQPQNVLTDNDGFYEVYLQDSLAPYLVYTEIVNCDNTIKRDSFMYTGNRIIGNDITLCAIAPPTPVRGYVYLGTSAKRPIQSTARVYLIQHCLGTGDTVKYVDSVLTDTNGFYNFNAYPNLSGNCQLIMKARLLPSASEYDKYLPAYHIADNQYALKWHSARNISKTSADSGINILLPEAMNPFGGPSVISGIAYYSNTSNVIKDRLMFITDMLDVPVAYTYTNNLGKFYFNNLQFGTYKIFGDAWNVENLDFIVKVDADNVYVQNIVFTEDNLYYKGGWPASVGQPGKEDMTLEVYPNPATEQLNVQMQPQNVELSISDIAGRTLIKNSFSNREEVSIDISELSPGVYILNAKTETANKAYKILKQ